MSVVYQLSHWQHESTLCLYMVSFFLVYNKLQSVVVFSQRPHWFGKTTSAICKLIRWNPSRCLYPPVAQLEILHLEIISNRQRRVWNTCYQDGNWFDRVRNRKFYYCKSIRVCRHKNPSAWVLSDQFGCPIGLQMISYGWDHSTGLMKL